MEAFFSKRGFTPYECLYTRSSTADNSRRFFPSSEGPRSAAGIKAVRPQADVTNLTGDIYMQFAFQLSDDVDVWPGGDTFTVIGTTNITADGIVGGNNGYDAVTLTKAHVRFGMIIRNNNAGSPKAEFVWVATRFDTRNF